MKNYRNRRGPLPAGIILLFSLIVPIGHAGELLILRNGTSEWISDRHSLSNRLYYKTQATGAQTDIPAADMATLLPVAERGHRYTDTEISNALATARSARLQFPKLIKQINPLIQEWEMLAHPEKECAGKIAEARERFLKGPRDTDSWKEETMAVEMIRYKDIQGTATSTADRVIQEMRDLYFTAMADRLDRLAASDSPSLRQYRMAVRLGDELRAASPTVAEQQRIAENITRCRQSTWNSQLRQVYALGSSRSPLTLDQYLHCSGILDDLDRYIAKSPEEQALLERLMEQLQALITRNYPDIRFMVNGYPMTEKDQTLLRRTSKWASVVSLSSISVEEQCLMFPMAPLSIISPTAPPTVSLILIFNREQPAQRRFALKGFLSAEQGQPLEIEMGIENLMIKHGRAEINYKPNLGKLPDGFIPFRQNDGRPWLLVYLAALDPDDKSVEDNPVWQPISRCIPIRLGE